MSSTSVDSVSQQSHQPTSMALRTASPSIPLFFSESRPPIIDYFHLFCICALSVSLFKLLCLSWRFLSLCDYPGLPGVWTLFLHFNLDICRVCDKNSLLCILNICLSCDKSVYQVILSFACFWLQACLNVLDSLCLHSPPATYLTW